MKSLPLRAKKFEFSSIKCRKPSSAQIKTIHPINKGQKLCNNTAMFDCFV